MKPLTLGAGYLWVPLFWKQGSIQAKTINKMEQTDDNWKEMGLQQWQTLHRKHQLISSKQELFQVLSKANSWISRRGQQIVEKWHQEIMQKSARKLSSHPFHAQKMPSNQWQLQNSSLCERST